MFFDTAISEEDPTKLGFFHFYMDYTTTDPPEVAYYEYIFDEEVTYLSNTAVIASKSYQCANTATLVSACFKFTLTTIDITTAAQVHTFYIGSSAFQMTAVEGFEFVVRDSFALAGYYSNGVDTLNALYILDAASMTAHATGCIHLLRGQLGVRFPFLEPVVGFWACAPHSICLHRRMLLRPHRAYPAGNPRAGLRFFELLE